MGCFSEDCHFVKQHGDCFYDGVPPSNSPQTCEACGFFKSKTNYDKITHMSVEELAEFISGKARTFGEEYEGYMSALDWLKQEVSE